MSINNVRVCLVNMKFELWTHGDVYIMWLLRIIIVRRPQSRFVSKNKNKWFAYLPLSSVRRKIDLSKFIIKPCFLLSSSSPSSSSSSNVYLTNTNNHGRFLSLIIMQILLILIYYIYTYLYYAADRSYVFQ